MFASFLRSHSMVMRGSVRIKFVKRDPGVKLGQSTAVSIPTNWRQTNLHINASVIKKRKKKPSMQPTMSHFV